MENLDKTLDLKVTTGLRNEFLCKRCDIFPRSDVKLMRCSSCTKLLCQNCSERYSQPRDKKKREMRATCPFCNYESKDPKISTFTEESQLMKLLSGFKTHPCTNLKNGCHEEIPAKLDTLKAHDQSCILQKVPCPKMDCYENIIFKDVEQHLEQVHTNEIISIFCGTEKNEYTHKPEIFGIYTKQVDELVNGRNYYAHNDSISYIAMWFTDDGYWMIGEEEGGKVGFAKVKKDVPFPDDTTNWEWEWAPTWTKANKGLGVKGISLEFALNVLNSYMYNIFYFSIFSAFI